MGEIVISSNEYFKTQTGEEITAEERAEFLIKNNYPVPTEDVEELTEIIAAQMKKAKDEKVSENASLSR